MLLSHEEEFVKSLILEKSKIESLSYLKPSDMDGHYLVIGMKSGQNHIFTEIKNKYLDQEIYRMLTNFIIINNNTKSISL